MSAQAQTPPATLAVRADAIPPALAALAQWTAWRWEHTPGRKKPWTKPPVNPRTGGNASSTNPATWATLAAALAAMRDGGLPGVGAMLTAGDDLFAIDLDNCRCPRTGRIEPWARAIITRFPGAYVEPSPTGTGVRLIGRASAFPTDGHKVGDVEVYWDRRFITVSGNPFPGREEIGDCTDELLAWHAETFPTPPPAPPRAANGTRASATEEPENNRDSDDEPPVELDDDGRDVWHGRRWATKSDGSVDRSDTLWWIACELREAGATRRTIAAGVAERDRVLWPEPCYADRPGQYDVLAAKVIATKTPRPRAAAACGDMPPADAGDEEGAGAQAADADPCAAARDELAAVRAELAEARRTVASIVQTVMNPYFTLAEIRAQASALSLAEHKRARGEAAPDGTVELSAAEIGNDWRAQPERGQPLPPTNPSGDKPRLPRETVKPTMAKLAERGLLRVREKPVKRTRQDGSAYADTAFVIEPPARLSDAYAAAATWRPADPTPRKPRTQRQPCPHCGEAHPLQRTDACTNCGGVVSKTIVLPPLIDDPGTDPPMSDESSETGTAAPPVVRSQHARKTIGHAPRPRNGNSRPSEPAHFAVLPDPEDPYDDPPSYGPRPPLPPLRVPPRDKFGRHAGLDAHWRGD